MKTHVIPACHQTPDWAHVPALAIDQLLWTPETSIRAQAQICYTLDALHVRMTAIEAHIRAEVTDVLGQPCEDSCLEFFFCPIAGDSRYFNVEFNPNGCVFLGLGSGIDDLVRLVPDTAALFCPNPQRIDGGWEIRYRIPTEFIRRFFPSFAAEPGRTMRANFYKCGDLTVAPHYLAWNPVENPTPAFHRPCDFGLLRFAEPGVL